MIALGVFFSTTIGSLIWGYQQFLATSAVPSPLDNRGKAEIFFDRPGLSAYMEANVGEGPNRQIPSMGYILSVKGSKISGTRFSLYLTGAARHEEHYPNGDKQETVNGCPRTLWTSPKIELACSKVMVPNDDLRSLSSPEIPAQLVQGILPLDSAGNVFLQIETTNEQMFSVRAGKRTYFSLPSVGSAQLPKELRDADLGTKEGGPKFVPTDLTVLVTYNKLLPNHRIENIVPSPAPADQLMWVEREAMAVRAYGSIVDVVEEEHGQQKLFLLAILAGFGASLLPIQIGLAFSLTKRRFTM